MNSVDPVIEGVTEVHKVFAADSDKINPLSVLKVEDGVMSRWHLTDEERKHIAEGGDLFICQLNFGKALQPIMPLACKPDEAMAAFIECTSELMDI